MKIVIINAVYEIGSTGRSYKELYDYLTHRGYDCKIIYGEKKNKDKDKDKDIIYMGSKFSHKIHALVSRITGKPGYYSFYSTKKLLKILNNYKPDIVHLGNLHANFINIPMVLKFLGNNNIKTTITLHDCYFYTGGCFHYTINNCYKWKKECKNCSNYKNQGSWFFDKTNYLFKNKKNLFSSIKNLGVIGVSNWITKEAKESSILKNAKVIDRIYDWVDLDIFKPINENNKIKKNLNIQNKFVILGVASGWKREKGLYNFIELSRILSNEYIIILVGDILEKINLPQNIINIPEINEVKKLVEYYNIADVFIHLSKEETFGKVTAEALACGLPAIVYNSTASPELVEEGCGYSIEITAEIQEVLEKLEVIKEIGKEKFSQKCREKAIRDFSKEKNCQKYIEVWSKL